LGKDPTWGLDKKRGEIQKKEGCNDKLEWRQASPCQCEARALEVLKTKFGGESGEGKRGEWPGWGTGKREVCITSETLRSADRQWQIRNGWGGDRGRREKGRICVNEGKKLKSGAPITPYRFGKTPREIKIERK